jgi:dienelactone hydrolase
MSVRLVVLLALAVSLLASSPSTAPAADKDTSRGDRMFAAYFRAQTEKVRDAALADIQSLDQWKTQSETLRKELLDMFGLDPLPEKTDLKPVVTGTVEHDEFVVEKLHFQSRPGLYVTANLYRPKEVDEPLPTVLYVCGHGQVKKGDISFGNKVHYQHHGAWFARNGYVCLVIDTLQLGEIEGIHHGTYRHDMWWWLNRGYTPAGVEAWNCIRALDYLETRPEVDKTRFGVTGRSGGGAYSWFIAGIDDRIKCAVPGAGVTDLQNHVIDGVVEGHCDCMYFHNTYRWDYPTMCALVAPRPLLISNTDTDPIFPLDGVYRTFEKVRHIYRLHGAGEKVGLSIGPGGHVDTQDLQVDAFRWFNRHLKNDDGPVKKLAEKFFEPEQLRVFGELPDDQLNTKIQETFVAAAVPPKLPEDEKQWAHQRDGIMASLKTRTFRSWPQQVVSPTLVPGFEAESDGVQLRGYSFTSEEPFELKLYVAQRAGLEKADLIVLNVLDNAQWDDFLATYGGPFADHFKGDAGVEPDPNAFASERKMFESFPWAMAYLAPRGVGPTSFSGDAKKQVQIRRRFQLIGQTLQGQQVYDVRQAIKAVRSVEGFEKTPLWMQAHGPMAGVVLYASLFEPKITRLDLHGLPPSHRDGPYLFNVQRILDMPQAVALAAERSQVIVYDDEPERWDYPRQVAERLGWEKRLQVRGSGPAQEE